MIIHDCVQGTDAWLRLRAGIPTASNFDKILTKSGKKSTSQEKYMFALLAERMMGHPRFEFMSHWMERGIEMEAKAVAYYEKQRDVDTVAVGFITDDLKRYGASPDRLVGESGLLQVKVPKDETHAMFLLGSGSVFDEYKVQAIGELMVAKKDFNDLISWHPEMPEAIVRTERDESFIKLLEEAVLEFSDKLESKARELAERGWLAKDRVKADPFSKETHEAYEAWSVKN